MKNDKMSIIIIKEDEWKSEGNYVIIVPGNYTHQVNVWRRIFEQTNSYCVEVTDLLSFMVNKRKSPIFIDLPHITIPFRSFTCLTSLTGIQNDKWSVCENFRCYGNDELLLSLKFIEIPFLENIRQAVWQIWQARKVTHPLSCKVFWKLRGHFHCATCFNSFFAFNIE